MGAIATNATTLDKVTSFIFRWLFSTNHKCGVLVSFVLGGCNLYNCMVIIKPGTTHLKFSKGVKRVCPVVTLMSLGKRTPIITPSFGGANQYGLDEIFPGFRSNLHCGVKRPCESGCFKDQVGIGVAGSKGLGETHISRGHWRYDYESGIYSRSGRYGKPSGLRDSVRNVVSLSCAKRNFSSGESHEFIKLNVQKGKYNNLTEVISDVGFLQGAYQKIKSNPGVLAPGSSKVTLDGLGESWFSKTSSRLADGSYQFEPARRVMIPKPNKPGLRPLTIGGSRDKIVQQAMKMVLEQIYEPKFLDTSHGFRPSRGCHSALENIRLNWTGISWFLEFDVEKCYDSIDRHRLVSILKEDIEDQRFFDLIFKLFNAGVIGWKEGLGPDPSEGLSQGSVLSPLLANIYLHKLDEEVATITQEYQKGKKRKVNKDVMNEERRIMRKKDFKSLSVEKQAAIMSKHRSERRKLGITMTDWNDPDFIRVRYVRYADDFLLGIAGSKELVVKIRDRITKFAKSNLKLNLTGGGITHIGAGKVKFLGVLISGAPFSKFPRRFGKNMEKKKRAKNRLLLRKKAREARLLKIVDKVVKKSFKRKGVTVDPVDLQKSVENLKAWIEKDVEFSREWVDTYRSFIAALTKTVHYVPKDFKEDLINFDEKLSKWEEKIVVVSENPKERYKELVGRYDALPPQINAPLSDIRLKLRNRGIISKANKPKAIGKLIHVPDDKIVSWYNAVGRSLLNYYCCCNNFYKVKSYVDYMVRWSAIHTLAGKHRSSAKKIISAHTKDLIIKDEEGVELTRFISSLEISTMRRQFRTNVTSEAGDKVLNQIWAKFTRTKFFGVECSVEGCENRDIEWHHVNKLNRMKDHFGNVSVTTKKGRRVTGTDAFKVAFNRKQVPLCKSHHRDLHNKKLSFSDINWDYVRDVT